MTSAVPADFTLGPKPTPMFTRGRWFVTLGIGSRRWYVVERLSDGYRPKCACSLMREAHAIVERLHRLDVTEVVKE
jgi:hypothetical protein